ncbi:MAG TPA: hypothetical protein VFQ53_02135 [Kofleriaceae bacterium]|nr:hypothetical protein [Kofleriaceae bacterium]
MVRGLVGCLVVAACGSPDAPPIGEVTVRISTNGVTGSDAVVPPRPIEGAFAFVDGGEPVRSDAAGIAVVPVTRELSTVHVIATDPATPLYTTIDVPVGATVVVGGIPAAVNIGSQIIDLPAETGAISYSLALPVRCVSAPQPAPQPEFFVGVRSGCETETRRVFGFVTTATATRYVTTATPLVPTNGITIPGPYQDLVTYTLMIEGATATQAAVGATSERDLTTAGSADVVGDTASIAAPPGMDAAVIRQAEPGATSQLIVPGAVPPGASTIDGAALLPIVGEPIVDGDRMQWDFDAGARDVDGMVLDATVAGTRWIVHGAPTTTAVEVPVLPAETGRDLRGGTIEPRLIRYHGVESVGRTFDRDPTVTGLSTGHAPSDGRVATTFRQL